MLLLMLLLLMYTLSAPRTKPITVLEYFKLSHKVVSDYSGRYLQTWSVCPTKQTVTLLSNIDSEKVPEKVLDFPRPKNTVEILLPFLLVNFESEHQGQCNWSGLFVENRP